MPALNRLHECSCSTCGRTGFLHWKVPVEAVRLVTEKRSLATCVWREVTTGHHFCRACGTAMIRSGYRTRVSVRCATGS